MILSNKMLEHDMTSTIYYLNKEIRSFVYFTGFPVRTEMVDREQFFKAAGVPPFYFDNVGTDYYLTTHKDTRDKECYYCMALDNALFLHYLYLKWEKEKGEENK